MVPIFSGRIPTIPEFFRNKNIFVTGGSGFVGKVLIEKLLRSCPDIGHIYVLLRERRGRKVQERVSRMTNIPLFDVLKKENCDAIKKIVPINGDVCKLGLGLNDEDRATIIDQVNVVFHIAASVRFDDPLRKAILYNVRSAVEVITLSKEIKNLAVFTHVSTAYCNTDKEVIEEKLYPAFADWREAIRLAEEMDEHVLEIFSQKYIQPHPNTYTFTKSLAEQAVNDLCMGRVPVVIFRPTIVVSSLKEPVSGWIDNFNGPAALSVAGGVGVLRMIYLDGMAKGDYVFVDNVVKALIAATWEEAVNRNTSGHISVYNCGTDISVPYSIYLEACLDILKKFPFEKRIWAPTSHGQWTTNYYYYYINVILFHLIPAMLMDGLLKLCGKEPLLLKLQRKMYIANTALFYFTNHTWKFRREKYLHLEDKLQQGDLDAFSFRFLSDFNTDKDVQYSILKGLLLGGKEYLLKENRIVPQKAILLDKSLRILDQTLKSIVYGFVLYALFWKYDNITYLLAFVYSYFAEL